MLHYNSAESFNTVVPLIFVSLFYDVKFCMYALRSLLPHDAEPNPPPLPDPRDHVVLQKVEFRCDGSTGVDHTVMVEDRLYVSVWNKNKKKKLIQILWEIPKLVLPPISNTMSS